MRLLKDFKASIEIAYTLPKYPPKEHYRTVKQKEGHLNCTACVAAMLVGCSIEEVHRWLRSEVGYPMYDAEFQAFLLCWGWMQCSRYEYGDQNLGPGEINTATEFQAIYRFNETPAYVAVRSKTRENVGHAILWDGFVFRDSSPASPDVSEDLTDYALLAVYPCFPMPNRLPLELGFNCSAGLHEWVREIKSKREFKCLLCAARRVR